MVQKIKLTTHQLPQKMAELIHSNQFLKLFSLLSFALLILALIAIILLSSRAPYVIAFDTVANQMKAESLPDAKFMVEKALRAYMNHRYDWTPEDVRKKLKEAREFINSSNSSAFEVSTSRVAEFSLSKKVSQRVFPTKVYVDLKAQKAFIDGDRVTSIMGIRADGGLKLELHFRPGPHTKANPWGVYVAKEVELL